MSAPLGDLLALAAFALLLLLPGLAVVAAPWPVVPFLSLAFWLGAWAWGDFLGSSRESLLRAALLSFAALSALRLLKPLPVSRPARGTLAVVAAALVAGLPYAGLRHDSGPRAAEEAQQALLLVAHDGRPSTRAPFEARMPLGVPDGVALLAADVAALSGVPVWRATLLVALGARGLMSLALLFFARRLGWPAAAAAALVALGVVSWPGLAPPVAALAAAYALVASALMARGTTRAPAVAAGACAAASWMCAPGVAALALAAGLAWSLHAWTRATAGGVHVLKTRSWAMAFGLAAFAGPGLARGLSAELAADAVAGLGVVGVLGLVMPMLAGLSAWPRAQALPALALAGCVALAGACAPLLTRGGATLGDEDFRAMEFLRANSRTLDAVAADDALRAAWLPAVAQRAACTQGSASGCRWRYVLRPFPARPEGRIAFAGETLQIIELK